MATNGPEAAEMHFCHTLGELQERLGHSLAQEASSPLPSLATFTFWLAPTFQVIIPRTVTSQQATPPETPQHEAGQAAANSNEKRQTVSHVINQEITLRETFDDDLENHVVQATQRVVSGVIAKAVQDVDGFKYNTRNIWSTSKGSRFNYTCGESKHSGKRKRSSVANAEVSETSADSNALIDCKGSVTLRFSKEDFAVELTYTHAPIHRTTSNRDPGWMRVGLTNRVPSAFKPTDPPLPLYAPSAPQGHAEQDNTPIDPQLSSSTIANASPSRHTLENPAPQNSFAAPPHRQFNTGDAPARAPSPIKTETYPAHIPTHAPPFHDPQIQGSQRLSTNGFTINGTPIQEGVFEHRPEQARPRSFIEWQQQQHPHPDDGEQVARIKRAHKRTKTGCLTCRARKIKCDESRPNCTSCRKGNRQCTYPSDSVPNAPPVAQSLEAEGLPFYPDPSVSQPQPQSTPTAPAPTPTVAQAHTATEIHPLVTAQYHLTMGHPNLLPPPNPNQQVMPVTAQVFNENTGTVYGNVTGYVACAPGTRLPLDQIAFKLVPLFPPGAAVDQQHLPRAT
ncbi:hypothetical protein L228DRAFT_283005 [Xylona heveae TC161]|uniref:Zn(2)-C6 fungal-type domain-containing protein n=1 Tax=Xylona heveae (strain CBS 132557 / TC161) TaxID=1328760 RepID=A0A165H3M2_XYLHT|nr:hypothetical protein L228DRAFT_283005 [Xylona heveae TC161]KZF22939.1 hypothetical protein L228DRAFT_283005 [Xylona heveae TC161]